MRHFHLFLIFACFLICGCKGTKTITERVEVPVVVTQEHTIESVKIDHVRDTIFQRDSVIYRDSVYHYVKGDTVIVEKWHYTTNNHYHQNATNVVRVDTINKTDSIEVPVVTTQTIEKRVEVPRPLSWWQKTLMIIGGCSMIALLLLLAYKTRKL